MNLVFPIILSITLSISAAVMLLVSPRILRARWRRIGAFIALALFAIASIKTAPDILDSPKGLWYSIRWYSTSVILYALIRMMMKLEAKREELPLRSAVWKKRPDASAK